LRSTSSRSTLSIHIAGGPRLNTFSILSIPTLSGAFRILTQTSPLLSQSMTFLSAHQQPCARLTLTRFKPQLRLHSNTPNFVIDPVDIDARLARIKIHKAPGPDGIPNWLLRDFSSLLCQPLAAIFNASIREGYFPPIWKSAEVVLIPKARPPTRVVVSISTSRSRDGLETYQHLVSVSSRSRH